MGWKTLRDRFEINNHIVQVNGSQILIGSGHVHDLVTIDMNSGELRENRTFQGFMHDVYPKLAESSTKERLEAIREEDAFSESIRVYTYDGGDILEKYCEKLGWPNTTHDGCLMYDNRFSTDKSEVVRWAKRNAASGVDLYTYEIDRIKKDLKTVEKLKQDCLAEKEKLDREFPDIKSE